jgi:NitT/TauT family transport system substrate-binding protein
VKQQKLRLNIFFICLIVVVAIALILPDLRQKVSNLTNFAQSPIAHLTTLRIGINNWPGFTVINYAQANGILAKRGLKVELSYFDNLQDATRAMMRGYLDLTFTSLSDVMLAEPMSDRPVLLLVTNISAGADGILAKPAIKSIDDLPGKKIAAKLGTINHLILLEALKLHKVDPVTVQISDISMNTGITELLAGKVDAAVLWEPELSAIARQSRGNIIFTTKETDSIVIDVIASKADFVASQRPALIQLMLAWFDLIATIEQKPEQVFTWMEKKYQLTAGDFAYSYQGLTKGDRPLNARMFGAEKRLEKAIEETSQLWQSDPRHSRIIRKDIMIDPIPVNTAIKTWQS